MMRGYTNGGGGSSVTTSIAGDVTGTLAAAVVEKINGASVPVSGALTVGNILYVSGVSALSYGALNLAGGANYVTGVLPVGNHPSMGGDVTGTITSSVVAKVNGASVPASGSLTTGNAPYVSGVSALTYSALNLAGGSGWVTGVLPKANQGSQDMGGDVTGSTAASVVAKVNGAAVSAAGSLTTGNGLYVSGASALTYSALNLAGGSNYVTGALPSANQAAQTMGGDITGTTAAAVVAKVNGATVPAAGSLTTGNAAYVSGASALTYSALNLAGGAGFVTGALPVANQVVQPLGGDLTGTTGTGVVARVNGAAVSSAGSLTTGNGLYVTGVSTLTYSALNLAGGANYVSGVLPKANQGAQDMAGDVTGNTGASVVAKVNGATVPAAGSLTTGNAAYVSGSSALTYSALNLAGGAGYVSGVLPVINLPSMGGDVTGTIAASVVASITGAAGVVNIASTGNILTWATATTAPGIKQADNTTNSATAANLTIQAANATGTTATGGSVVITSGTGTTATGAFTLNLGATTVATWAAGTYSATGTLRNANNTVIMTARNAANSADIPIITTSSGNLLTFGGIGTSGVSVSLLCASGGTLSMGCGGTNISMTSTVVSVSTATFQFSSQIATPLIRSNGLGTDVAVTTLTVRGQSAYTSGTGTNRNGGALLFQGGARTDTNGRMGGIRLSANGTDAPLVEICDVQAAATSSSQAVVLCRGSAITATEMPTGTGDLVVYLGNCATAPTVAPVSGGVLYVSAGALKFIGTSGTITTLAAA